MDKTAGGVGASSLASTERRLKEALEELSEVEGLVDAISGAWCSEHFLADASQRMLLLAPQIRALATSTHVAHPSCLPLLEELKSRAARVSQEYTRRSEQYKRSVLAPPEPSKKPTPPPPPTTEGAPPVGQEGKKKSQVTPTQQDHGPIIVDDDEAAAAVAKRLRNMALFEQAVKKNVQRSEVKAKRKSIGVEFATSELKKAEKPVVDRDYPPPITPHTSKPQQLPFDASREFFAKGRLQLEQHLADGFYDLGFIGSQQATQGLPALEAVKTLSLGSGEEEVVLIDRRHDTRLAFLAAEAERFCGFIPDTELRTKMLSLFVSNAMGGSRIDNNHAPPLSQLHSEDVQRLVAKETNNNILAIGEMAHGGLRHRALLFKYLADLLGVASELVRSDDVPGVYWNVVELEKKRFLVDVMHRPATLHPLHSLTYYAYTRITPPATHPTSGTQLKPHAHESLLSYEPDALSSVTSSKPGVRAGYRWVLPQDLSRAQLVLLDKLGSGGCASVWRCKLGGFTCAVKIINTEAMSKSSRKRVMQEIELLQKLQHRNIVAFLGKEIMDKELHIFMELVPYSLFEIIQQVKKGLRPPFTPDEIITCITHMAKALMYLHGLPDKVIHRDCKSKNVLIELGSGHEAARIQKAKLCDFGVSKVVTESTQADTSIGTSRWMAPEVVAVLDGKRESYDEKSDVWALGMVLFEMLTYRLPYEEVGLLDVRDHVLKGHSPAFSGEVQEDYAPFLPLFYNCTKFKPEERYSAEQALLHLLRL